MDYPTKPGSHPREQYLHFQYEFGGRKTPTERANMKQYKKKNYPVADVRRFLEPTPAVLVSSVYRDKHDLMTMGWYTIMEFTPSLIGCMITASNYSFGLIEKSGECVINLPTRDIAKTVVAIGNSSGANTDKFKKFGLTPQPAEQVKASLIAECFASFECRLHDRKLVKAYNFFVFEVVKAHVANTPKYPETIHYRGDSIFMVSGKNIRIPSMK
jgi:flavin reductase (DIM6/NTAB) family NADH-FMN oxidoreductase RutF